MGMVGELRVNIIYFARNPDHPEQVKNPNRGKFQASAANLSKQSHFGSLRWQPNRNAFYLWRRYPDLAITISICQIELEKYLAKARPSRYVRKKGSHERIVLKTLCECACRRLDLFLGQLNLE
jgi:hypothetical protein